MTIKTSVNDNEEMLRLMAWIEICGSIGHSSEFTVNVDGDGRGRVKFDFPTLEEKSNYNRIKNELFQKWNDGKIDVKEFNIE